EVLLFGALFALYGAYRAMYGADFVDALHHNDVVIGTTNTFILITSSFFVAWALHAVRIARRRMAVLSLVAAVLLGAAFLALKGVEYTHHFEERIYPGAYYAFGTLPTSGARLFFTLYFFMTGLHALHVIAGMVLLTCVAFMTHKGK